MSTKWSHPAIDGLTARLDGISEDIIALERYLEHSAVRVEAWVVVEGGGTISWKLGEPDRWRIIYALGDERRPLIEAKAEVRLRAAPALPALLEAIGARVAAAGKTP